MGDHGPGLVETYSVDEALEAVGFGKFQVLVLFYAGIGCVAEAMEIMILSFVGPAVKSQWGLSSAQESLLTTVVFAGMLVGAYSWGLISDNFGRRKGLLSVAIVTTTCSFLSAFSTNYMMLLVFRALSGIGLGGAPVYTSWFLEFVPAPNRGTWMVIFATFWTVGSILEALLAWIVMPGLGWRWLLLLSSVPTFGALIFYGLAIESPRYLYAKGRINEAYNVLRRMAWVNQAELPSGMLLVRDETSKMDEELAPSEQIPLFSTGKNKVESFKAGFSSLLTLFSSSLWKSTLLLWVIYFGNSLSYYGVVLLTSELNNGETVCGSTAVHLKSTTNSNVYRDTLITSFAEVPGLALSAITVDRIGRKNSMALFYALSCIFLFPLVIHQSEVLTTISLFGARMCIIGNFTVAGIYCPEIYPTSARSTAVGVASSVGRIGGMISPILAVQLVTNCHQFAAILLFEAVLILSGFSVLLFPHETKGQRLTDSISE